MLNTDVRISLCCFPLQLPDLQSLSKAATSLFISSRELRKSCFCTLGKKRCWCEFHNTGEEGKAGEDRREMLCGLRHWQVQRFAVSMQAHALACVCWRVCGRWKEQRIAMERGGRVIEWESGERDGERYGRWLVHVGGTIWWPKVVRYTDSLQMSSQPPMVFYWLVGACVCASVFPVGQWF